MDVPRIRQVSPRGAQRHHLPLGRGPERAHPFSSRVSGTHAGAAWNDSMRTMLAGRAVQPSHRVAPRVMGRRSAHSDLEGYTVPHCTRGISTFSPTLSEGFPVGSVRRRRRGTAGPAQGNRPPEGAGASGRLPRPPSSVENPVPSAGRNPVNSAGSIGASPRRRSASVAGQLVPVPKVRRASIGRLCERSDGGHDSARYHLRWDHDLEAVAVRWQRSRDAEVVHLHHPRVAQ
jgi:hypothetical protein